MTRYLKPVVFVLALEPVALLVHGALTDGLGANPIDRITDVTGTWTLRFVLISLAVTPLRRLTGWNGAVRFRRMLGLFAFFYGTLHFLTWAGLDQGFAWAYVLEDVAKRRYITAGFIGFVSMVPLAVTSTTGWIRRLGGRNWNRLHRLVYLTGVAGVVHYLWLVKVIEPEQMAYAAILAGLLGLRAWWALQKRWAAAPTAALRTAR
jgi:sulfoxide reductase heme-binding subunit YedZ